LSSYVEFYKHRRLSHFQRTNNASDLESISQECFLFLPLSKEYRQQVKLNNKEAAASDNQSSIILIH